MPKNSSFVDDGREPPDSEDDRGTIREFRSWFAKQHRKRIGVRYKGDCERIENDIIRKLLRRFSTTRLRDLSDLFFGTGLWRGCRKQHAISMLYFLINRGWPEEAIPGVTNPKTDQPRETSEAEFVELSRRVKEQRDNLLPGEDPV